MRASAPSLACGALIAALSGCAVGPRYHAPHTDAPHAFDAAAPAPEDASATTAVGVDLTQWWHSLNDPELDSLIDRAVRANPDIELALTRLQIVRSQQAVLVGDALPAITAAGFSGRGSGTDLTKAGASSELRAGDNKGSLAQIRQIAGFSASWELDAFGGLRKSIEAGRYDIQAASWARNAVLTSVIADVAANYVDLRGLQQRVKLLESNISSATELRDFEQQRFDHGLTNELDLQLSIRELERLHAELPVLQSQMQATQYRIAVLLGHYPEDMVDELSAPGALPDLPQTVKPGLPLDLLQRRPDIRHAERQLAAATARIGVATANLFPHVDLTGALGTQSGTNTAQGSHIWAFGPSVYWPLLDFGALDALVNVADLQAHEQLVSYRMTVINAVQDADDAIARYRANEERVSDLTVAIKASQRAVELARQRFDRGLTDFLNVIDAERQQYTLEDEYTTARQGAADSFVFLYRALGGGWEAYQDIPPIRHALPAVIAGPRRLLTNNDPQHQ